MAVIVYTSVITKTYCSGTLNIYLHYKSLELNLFALCENFFGFVTFSL